MRCQTAFISRVINGPGHFTLEHAAAINTFLDHTEEEAEYFLLLVHRERAGTKALRDHYTKQTQRILDRRQIVAERIQVKTELGEKEQLRYYSAWYFAAIHILTLVPRFQSKNEIAAHLKLPTSVVSECLEFLMSVGLVKQEGGRLTPGTSRLHLGKSSPMLSKHHTNWRMRAIHAVDSCDKGDLFFSGPIAISEEVAEKIKSALLKVLEETEPLIRESKEEAVFCLNLDFFRV